MSLFCYIYRNVFLFRLQIARSAIAGCTGIWRITMGNSSSRGRSKLRQGHGSKVAPSFPAGDQSEQKTFKWSIDGFSSLLDKGAGWTYSRVFEAMGHNWYLKLNPRDKKSGDSKEYVSLRLELANSSVKPDTVVDASFKLMIYDQSFGKHSEHEVTTSKANTTSEILFVQKTSIFNEAKSYTWDIDDFFSLKNPGYSPEFEAGGYKWNIAMCPSREGNHLSLYLKLKKTNDLPEGTANLVELTLSIKDQETGKHRKGTGRSNQGKNQKSSKVAAVPSTSAETEGKSSFKWRIDGFSSLLDKHQGWTSSRYFEIKGLKWYLQLNLKDLSHHFQTEESRSSGASCMVPVETLKEPSSGFIVGDSCIFGVELIKLPTAKANRNSETLHVQKTNGFSARESYAWVIDDFLALKGRCYSPHFEIGGRKWYLTMYPSGIDDNGEFLSLYLHMGKPDASLQRSGVLVELNLSITDKVTSNRYTMTGRCQFLATEEGVGWGWAKFMAVKSVKDWYLVKGSFLIEADIAIVGSSKME
ncbi:hypothetical protein HU200_049489 [Digitaria exilis]|uniref:MATH domain-containing protein n=1 Tax=Digitaria exilis TaxID=1010633 RepID=A0A835E9P2_9POAL|nr:hypothetical protein HU200_049489 [Digitaria exilis]